MKYFIDTEFIEGFHKLLFGKRRHFIDLISIGIYCEDGRSYHAISNEWKFKDADEWVQKNVIIPLYIDTVHGDARNRYDAETFHHTYGKSNKQIATEIIEFINHKEYISYPLLSGNLNEESTHEFYGYYADYDWVLFCSLFGRMIDLPKGFPMYCIDLKQKIDETATRFRANTLFAGYLYREKKENTLENALSFLKDDSNYPKQENEHNALADTKWNYKLYKFLNNI